MKATITGGKDRFCHSHRREKTANFEEHAIIDPATKSAAISARIYWGRSRCYCCVWLRTSSVWMHGSGYVDGYGFHKASAAVSVALENTGVTLSERIDGVGDSAIKDALLATALALGVANPIYHHSHP